MLPRPFFLGVLLLSLGADAGFAAQDVPTVVMDYLYEGSEGGVFFDEITPEDVPGGALELGDGERLMLPSGVTGDDVVEVKPVQGLGPELEDALVVGLGVRWQGYPEAYALLYGGRPGQRQIKVQMPMREHYGQSEVVQLGEERGLALRGISGMHFDDLWVYRFQSGRPELLLAKGSAAGVELKPDATTGTTQVWVGIEDWDDPTWNYATGARLWNVYRWNGVNFVFDAALSTTREVPLDERIAGFVQAVHEEMEKEGE